MHLQQGDRRQHTPRSARFNERNSRRDVIDWMQGVNYGMASSDNADAVPAYTLLEHTADIGLEARGASLEELFANCGTGLFSLVTDLSLVKERESRELELEAGDYESLLVRWLSRLLYFLDAEEMLFKRFDVQRLGRFRIKATAWGEPIRRDSHDLRLAIKAVTYHKLEVQEIDGGWRAQVYFDI